MRGRAANAQITRERPVWRPRQQAVKPIANTPKASRVTVSPRWVVSAVPTGSTSSPASTAPRSGIARISDSVESITIAAIASSE